MVAPLVLKNGVISEELSGEVGVYPYLGIQAGVLKAGVSGLNKLRVVAGRVSEYVVGSGVRWDMDGPPMVEAIWDSGASTWS